MSEIIKEVLQEGKYAKLLPKLTAIQQQLDDLRAEIEAEADDFDDEMHERERLAAFEDEDTTDFDPYAAFEDEETEEIDSMFDDDEDVADEDTVDSRLDEIIKKRGDKWVVLTHDGKKKLGTHASKKAAEKQLDAIHINKAKAAGHKI